MPQAVGIASHATPFTPSAASGSQSGSTSSPTRQCDERRRELLDGAVPGRPGREVWAYPLPFLMNVVAATRPFWGVTSALYQVFPAIPTRIA